MRIIMPCCIWLTAHTGRCARVPGRPNLAEPLGIAQAGPFRAVFPDQASAGSARAARSTEMTPVRGDDEKHASANERTACDNRSRHRHLEGRDLSGDEPDTGKQDQQEADLGECDARLMTERKHRNDGSYSDRSVLPAVSRDPHHLG
jgi:hypothetical protein